MKTTRVLVSADQPLYRAGLRSLVESTPELCVVAECTSDPSSVDQALKTEADLVLLDFDLVSGRSPGQLQRLLTRFAPRPTLILSTGVDPDLWQVALRNGVSGLVPKSSPGETLLEALTTVARGQVWLDRALLSELFADSSHIRRIACDDDEKIARLSPREREIVGVAASGVSNKQIGQKLSISEATVRHHLVSIFDKLGVSTRVELVVYAHRHHLFTRPDPLS